MPAGEASTITEESYAVTAKRRGGRHPEQGNYSRNLKESVLKYASDHSVKSTIVHFKKLEPDKMPISRWSIYRWAKQLDEKQQNKAGSDPK